LLYLVLQVPVLEAIRKRVTYPRIGYVELVQEEPKELLRGIAVYSVIVILVAALAFTIFGAWEGTAAPWLKWSPALVGTLISGGFIYSASKSGAARYYVFVVLSVGLGFAFSILFSEPYTGLTFYLLTMGALFILCGAVTFLRFLRKYPLLAEEAADVTD
jgi:hypothetical protein